MLVNSASGLMRNDTPINIQMLHQVLKGQGYHLLMARNAEDALRIARDERPDLVLLDLNMPGMQGDEMVTKLRRLRPDLKVLYVTAFTDDLFDAGTHGEAGHLWHDEAFLDKPFTRDGLVQAVSLLLHGSVTH